MSLKPSMSLNQDWLSCLFENSAPYCQALMKLSAVTFSPLEKVLPCFSLTVRSVESSTLIESAMSLTSLPLAS